METKPTMELSGSSVPGVVPEPIRVHHDSAPSDEGDIAGRPPPAPARAEDKAVGTRPDTRSQAAPAGSQTKER
jgi:hypothetical protein